MKYIFALLFSFSLPLFLLGQQVAVSENEMRIAVLFDSLKVSSSDSEKKEINSRIIKLFTEELQDPASFAKPYSSLNFVGKISSDDGKVKIYTWNYPLSDKTHGYGGFIQYRIRSKTIKTIPLTIKTEAYVPFNTRRILPNKDWYGALYYKIARVRYKKETYYLVLGWARANAASEFKVIEMLNFDDKGNATFGKGLGVLKYKHKTLQRFVLEYNADAKISLTYNEKTKRIVFDHLAPTEPVYTNVYSHYGPNFTYDSFVFQKGKWVFEGNVDVRNKD